MYLIQFLCYNGAMIHKYSFEHLLNKIIYVGTCPPIKRIPVVEEEDIEEQNEE